MSNCQSELDVPDYGRLGLSRTYHGPMVTKDGKKIRDDLRHAPENHCLLALTDEQTGKCVYAGQNQGGGFGRMYKFACFPSGFCHVNRLDHMQLVASIYQHEALRDLTVLRRAAAAFKLLHGWPSKHYPVPN